MPFVYAIYIFCICYVYPSPNMNNTQYTCNCYKASF